MRNIICFGDSNTFGYSGDPNEKKGRFNNEQRWPCLLQKELGNSFSVKEEGANGRTIQFQEPNQPGLSGFEAISGILQAHSPVSLLIIMLGSNDTQERFSSSPDEITLGLKKLINLARKESTFEKGEILILAPPAMQMGLYQGPFATLMGNGAVEKSVLLGSSYKKLAMEENSHFLDVGTKEMNENGINQVDFLHINLYGHKFLSELLAPVIRELLK